MMSPLNKPKKLAGWWSFDDKFAHDYSGNNLDGNPIPQVGPSSCKFFPISYKKKFSKFLKIFKIIFL